MAIKRLGDKDFYIRQKKLLQEQEKDYTYKDELRVWLNQPLSFFKENHHDLYLMIKKKFKNADDNMTLNEVRMTKLFENAFLLNSNKAIELTYKLDGSMNELAKEVDLSDVIENIGGIEWETF